MSDRLEEIKERVVKEKVYVKPVGTQNDGYLTKSYTVLEEDWNLLIEQAERVEELVYENFQLKDDVNRLENEYLHGVKQQNNRYREAIEQVLHLKQQKENNVFEYSYDEIEEREESLLMDVLEESS